MFVSYTKIVPIAISEAQGVRRSQFVTVLREQHQG